MNATEQACLLFDKTKHLFSYVVPGLAELSCEDLPAAILDYIKTHPYTSSFQLVCLLVASIPSLVATPALVAMGFSATGPVAGWLAATYQSIYGVNFVFSTLQSAMMGGYGAPIVNGIVSAGSVLAGGVTEAVKWWTANNGTTGGD